VLHHAYGIGTTTLQNRKQAFRSGNRDWEHGGTGHAGNLTEAGSNTRIWMRDHFDSLGDHPPTLVKSTPPGDKKDIFDEMQHDLDGASVKESQFNQIWKDEFAHSKLPAQQRLGKYKECDTFRKTILATRDKDEY